LYLGTFSWLTSHVKKASESIVLYAQVETVTTLIVLVWLARVRREKAGKKSATRAFRS
jgi:hypothetical protein